MRLDYMNGGNASSKKILFFVLSIFPFFELFSVLKRIILGFKNFFGCYSKPAYENVFLKATTFTKKDRACCHQEPVQAAHISQFIDFAKHFKLSTNL